MTDDLQNLLAGIVKPLEWEYRDQQYGTYRADHYWISRSFGPDSYYFATVRQTDGRRLYDGDDLEAAQSAAQADYTARIASALNLDAVLALVAAAYADAAGCVFEAQVGDADNDLPSIFNRIRSRTPTDATAALARMMADARAEGFSDGYAKGFGDSGEGWNGEHPAHDFTTDKSWLAQREAAIRAMKGEQP